jgi:hypothetical protein
VPQRNADVAATDLPAVGTLIHLVLEGHAALDTTEVPEGMRSRIEDVILRPSAKEPHHLLIAAPTYGGDVEPLAVDAPCAVVWATPKELIELPTAFVDEELSGPLVLVWQLAVTGAAIRLQRRDYGRVPMTLPVRISTINDPDAVEQAGETEPEIAVRDGHTQDVSEGGVLCALEPPALPTGTPALVELEIEGVGLSLRACVVRTFPIREQHGGPVVVTAIRFENPDEYGDVVRRAVFAEQMRNRKKGLL